MSKSLDKVDHFVSNQLKISDTKFAESIGLTKNAYYKYMKRARGKDNQILRVDIASRISTVYKIDVYYFLDDDIPESDDPVNTNPIITNVHYKTITNGLVKLTQKVDDLLKKYEASNNDSLQLISKIAEEAVNEVVSVVVKFKSESKKLDLNNNYLSKILYEVLKYQITLLQNDADYFKKMINHLDINNTKQILDAIEAVYLFKDNYHHTVECLSNLNKLIAQIIKLNESSEIFDKKYKELDKYIDQLDDDEYDFNLNYFNYHTICLWASFILLRDIKRIYETTSNEDSNVTHYIDDCMKKLLIDEEENIVNLYSDRTTMNALGTYAINSLTNPNAIDLVLKESLNEMDNIEKKILKKSRN